MNWQPIETAPKNGNVMLWIVGLPWPGYRHKGRTWSNAHGLCNEQDPTRRDIVKATHWAKRPEPPK